MKNKEIIKKLTRYFLNDCDPKVVAKMSAAMFVDMNRIRFFEKLPDSEKECLMIRIGLISEELQRFLKEGPTHGLIVENISFEDEE